MRLIFWLALVIIVILALKKKSRNFQVPSQAAVPDDVAPKPGRSDGTAETMICCQHCQVYFPASEAIYKNQQAYCSQAHADLSQS